MLRLLVLTLTFCIPVLATKWQITADKKSNPVTGARWVAVHKVADKGSALLLFACDESSQKRVQIRQDFGTANAISDALTRSRLDSQVNRGYQYERYGFLFTSGGTAKLKMRFEPEPTYVEVEANAVIDGRRPGLQILNLDSQLGWLLERAKESSTLLVELPYKTGAGFATFSFLGFTSALAKALEKGCIIR